MSGGGVRSRKEEVFERQIRMRWGKKRTRSDRVHDVAWKEIQKGIIGPREERLDN
jgi:hypothetical protein